MAPQENAPPGATGTDAHRLARLLRHEVGDLLQSVYSTVGILVERLPNELKLERRLLTDLKNRAEVCKLELDGVVDLVAPLSLTPGPTDLMAVVHSALLQAQRRFPALQVHFDAADPARVETDGRALAGSLGLLILAFCQGAQRQVWASLRQDGRQVECSLQRDGYAVTAEQLTWIDEPFATTQQALFGLGLALVHRVVRGSGGAVSAANRPEGGVCVRIVIPLLAPPLPSVGEGEKNGAEANQ